MFAAVYCVEETVDAVKQSHLNKAKIPLLNISSALFSWTAFLGYYDRLCYSNGFSLRCSLAC